MTKKALAEANFADLLTELGLPARKTETLSKNSKALDRIQPRRLIPSGRLPASRTAQRRGGRHEHDRIQVTVRTDLADTAIRIRRGLKKGVDGIIEAALEIHTVKRLKLVKHGQFTAWVTDKVGVHIRTAQWLINIAEDKDLIKPCHRHALPPSIRTLYELTKIRPAERRRRLFAEGRISAGTNREEAIALRWETETLGGRPNPEQRTAPIANRDFTPKPSPAVATVLDGCILVAGGDVVRKYILGQEKTREVFPRRFARSARSVQKRLVKLHKRRSRRS